MFVLAQNISDSTAHALLPPVPVGVSITLFEYFYRPAFTAWPSHRHIEPSLHKPLFSIALHSLHPTMLPPAHNWLSSLPCLLRPPVYTTVLPTHELTHLLCFLSNYSIFNACCTTAEHIRLPCACSVTREIPFALVMRSMMQ